MKPRHAAALALVDCWAMLGVLMLSGCWPLIFNMATKNTPTDQLQLASNPPGATATLSSLTWNKYAPPSAATAPVGASCQTPCDLVLPRGSTVVITFTKPDCKPNLVSVSPRLFSGVIHFEPNPAVADLDCALAPKGN
jgi:hypothetical protein